MGGAMDKTKKGRAEGIETKTLCSVGGPFLCNLNARLLETTVLGLSSRATAQSILQGLGGAIDRSVKVFSDLYGLISSFLMGWLQNKFARERGFSAARPVTFRTDPHGDMGELVGPHKRSGCRVNLFQQVVFQGFCSTKISKENICLHRELL
jgi:hypothetical protein